MVRKIVVLDDGETWSEEGQVWTITEEAWKKLSSGEVEVCDLTGEEVIHCVEVNTDD